VREMQNRLVGFTHDEGFRVFSFDRRGDDNTRTSCDVRVDLALTRTYGIRVQELPLLCRSLLDKHVEAGGVQSLTFAESDMRACADARDAARELAAKKHRPWRRPAAESISTSNRGISEPNNYENTPVI
jgi:hypothetical protein